MIYTLTLNPALDFAYLVSAPAIGHLNRSSHSYYSAAGKGINVSRALAAQGLRSSAIVPLGGAIGKLMQTQLEQSSYQLYPIGIAAESRCNVKIVDEASGDLTEFNAPGAALSEAELDACVSVIAANLTAGDSLVLSGSLPPGVPPQIYWQLIRLAKARGAQAFLDASGESLDLALAAGPSVVKPNLDEAEALLGLELITWQDAVDAATQIRQRGAELVVLSLGASGALFQDASATLVTRVPPVKPSNTTGCGDTLVAACLVARTEGWALAQLARYATALASAKATTANASFPSRQDAATLTATTSVHNAQDVDLSTALA